MANFTGCLGGSRVWEFKGDGCSWVTWSVGHDPPTPRAGSAAAAWLTLTVCNELAPATMFDRKTALALVALLKTIRRREGLRILAGRSYTGSGPHPVPVAGYRSMRAAARALGISRYGAAAAAGRPYLSGKTRRSDFDDSSGSDGRNG